MSMSRRVIRFTRRKGPGRDVFDANERRSIKETLAFIGELEEELLVAGSTPGSGALVSRPASATVRFFDALRRVCARVRLIAAQAFANAAEKHRQFVAERAQYKSGTGGGRRPGRETPAVFVVQPIRAQDSFEEALTKLLLFIMSSSTKRSEQELRQFVASVTTTSMLIQLDQWITHAARVFDLVDRETRPESVEKATVAANAMIEAAKKRGIYAEGESAVVANRDGVMKMLLQNATRSDDDISPIHKLRMLQPMRSLMNAEEVMRVFIAKLFEHNRQSGAGANPYTNVANRIGFTMAVHWERSDLDVRHAIENKANQGFVQFVNSVQGSELRAVATTRHIGVKVAARTDQVVRTAIFNALNDPNRKSSPDASPKFKGGSRTSAPSSPTPVKRGRPKSGPTPGKSRDDFQQQSLGLPSYMAPRDADDDSQDMARATELLTGNATRAFREAVQDYRGKRRGGRRTHQGGGRGDDEGGGDSLTAVDDESMSDEINNVIEKGARFLAIAEQCGQMLLKQSSDEPDMAPAVPLTQKKGTWPRLIHPSDGKYHLLHLVRYDKKADVATDAAQDVLATNAAARRRWWWAYMFVSLVKVDILGRKGPRGPGMRAVLEVAEFIDSPIAFASNDERHWVVTGPPGTGKTSFMRLLAVLYHLLSLYPLASINDDAISVLNLSDFIAGFEGQTPLRVLEVFIRHCGTFMPFDEAYALVPIKKGEPPSTYNQQIIEQIVVTLNEFGPLIGVALIGYSGRILERLLRVNEGLQRRFPRTLNFPEYNQKQLVAVMRHVLELKRPDLLMALDEIRNEVEMFFEFITGRVEMYFFPQGSTKITLERDFYAVQRADEDDGAYEDRVNDMKANQELGSFFADLNASGAVSVAKVLMRNKHLREDPNDLSILNIIEATRFLLLQQNVIDYEDTAATSDTSMDDPTED